MPMTGTDSPPDPKLIKKLLERGIHGGKDLSNEFPELGKTALYCVTEIHSEEEIERLATVLEEILVRR